MKTLTIYCPNGKNWFIRIRNDRNNKIVADGCDCQDEYAREHDRYEER